MDKRFSGRRIVEAGVLQVFLEDVNLPQVAVGVGDPELGLPGVAALHALLTLAADAGALQALLDAHQGGAVGHAEAEVVERTADRTRRRPPDRALRNFWIVQLE